MLLTKQKKLELIRKIIIRQEFLDPMARAVVSLFLEVETYDDYEFCVDFCQTFNTPNRYVLELVAVPHSERVLQLSLF